MEKVLRYECNPVLSAGDLPYESSLVFNAGVCKYNGKYVMVFRNDVGFSPSGWDKTYTNLGLAFSDDGVKWTVSSEPWRMPERIVASDPDFVRFYDPRLTVIDGECYICFAVDTRHGVRGGIARTEDFDGFEILSMTVPDNRNMVLFPERIGGRFFRLERPFPVYGRGGGERFDIWSSSSPDCRCWGDSKLVLGVEDVPFANSKIGPAAPPIRTKKGWLTTFHAVNITPDRRLEGWEKTPWHKEYLAGLMLLGLEDPAKVVGLYESPLLRAERSYELNGFRGSVIFPGGMIAEDDGSVKIYYGAADTVECLAYASIDELLELCHPIQSK